MTSTKETISSISILSLPNEVLDNILTYVSYDEVSHVRLVCRRFDESAQRVLNQGFFKVGKFHARCVRTLKELLPRRESERRKHPLSGYCDILTAIESRLSLLDMTFTRHIELEHCCFIPGKVLDEIFRVLRLASSMKVPPRSYELLQELRDISSMAMEYFDEKIIPTFRNKQLIVTKSLDSSLNTNKSKGPIFVGQMAKLQMMYNQLQTKAMKLNRENLKCRRKMIDFRSRLNDMDRITTEQNAIILQHAAQLNIQDAMIAEVTQKLAGYTEFMTTVLQHEDQHTLRLPHRRNCGSVSTLNVPTIDPETSPSTESSPSKRLHSSNKNSPPRKRAKKF